MITASEVMHKEPLVVPPSMSVQSLAELLVAEHSDGACVVEDGNLVGVVTAMDLVFQEKNPHIQRAIALFDSVIPLESGKQTREELEKIAGTWVRDIMTTEAITVTSKTSLSDAATLMVEKHLTLLPVVDGDDLLGVITKRDVLRTAFNID
ncbi:MAG: CBS domain-containing protein [Deltaproteobacteria bacterium]|nr:MAG: CBS domain-containing protein [Deltaproteobacteria bacterium]